jgi:molybdopterin-containing oxidoreductase family membrane subunit
MENIPDSFITGRLRLSDIARQIIGIPLRQGLNRELLAVLTGAFLLFLLLGVAITWLFIKGVGIWGINIPVAWGVAISNFVWWIGIGHAGTFISAFLYLLHQEWRASINRFAETVTLFAVICAGLFPLLHLGRPQFFYWLVPYPNTMWLWQENFDSGR